MVSIGPDSRVVFLTGAGVSVASGIRPFRGPGGLWSEEDPLQWSSAAALVRDFEGCFQRHREMALSIFSAQPNAAHQAIAALEKKLQNETVVLTQNVDSLHQKAGSTRVVEVHGSLARLRCADEACETTQHAPDPSIKGPLVPCPKCGRWMRYDMTLFDEALSVDALWASRKALRQCDIFIAVGTSGVVSPAAEFVREAHYAGAHTVLVNLEQHEKPNHYFLETLIGKAEEILPKILEVKA